MKTILYMILFSILPLQVFSENTVISGNVVSDETGKTLPYVTVMVKGTGIGTVTDAHGHYKIPGLKPGKHILVAKSVGYIPAEKEINIQDGQTATINFKVKEDLVQLNEVVVSSNRN